MKTCFISRLGGAGDVLHASHLPKLIKEHYKVDRLDVETNYHGMHILTNNPFIDNLTMIDVHKMTYNRMSKNLEWALQTYDLVFNFANTIEKEYCLNENDWRYYTSQDWRRQQFGKKSYYDVMTEAAGLPGSYYGTRGKLYYFEDEHVKAQEWIWKTKQRMDSEFVILFNLSGSTLHKKFVQAEAVAARVFDLIPNAVIVLTGDEYCKKQVFEHPRVLSKVEEWNFRTVALMCKYFDLTVSLESGIALVAHSWDAPTLQLLTAASPENHCMYAKNAYWIQAPIECSPCHKNPREYFGCPVKDKHPKCVYFDETEIGATIKEIYECSRAIA